MRVVEIIEAKKDGYELAEPEIAQMVAGFASGEIPDYQMSAFLMAVACKGMSLDETTCLTRAMVNSGKTLDLSSISGIKLDKHSSGGVGDKVTLALVPILATAGVPIAKMSGHGLGHTGGTLDKLESIPGFRTELSEEEIITQVERIGACICGQTDTITPADRLMYALRDVTGSVASIPLIASSIMSKRIACGADAILLDIKVGTGAFMKSTDTARELAQTCQAIARFYDKRITIFLTDMNQPLGRGIGNANEVYEVLGVLKGDLSDLRLTELTVALCSEGLKMSGIDADPEQIIKSGLGYAKFDEIVKSQGGSIELFWNELQKHPKGVEVGGDSGYVHSVDALKIGRIAQQLGAGRAKKGDSIDPYAGIWLEEIYGHKVAEGSALASLSSSNASLITTEMENSLRDAYVIRENPPAPSPLILEIIGGETR